MGGHDLLAQIVAQWISRVVYAAVLQFFLLA